MPTLKMSMSEEREHNGIKVRTWVDVDTSALEHNFGLFKDLIDDSVELCVVAKSNAYGHTLTEYALLMEKLGADRIAVDSIAEALRLREVGVTVPILVLGYTFPDLFERAAENAISVGVSNYDALDKALSYSGTRPLSIHVKWDTGMHRQGFLEHDVDNVVERLSSRDPEQLVVEGVFTHFADAKNPSERQNTNVQIETFDRIREKFTEAGFTPIAHAAASSGTILFPEAHYDMVRVGIGMYGLWPSHDVELYAHDWFPLKPALSWRSVISEVKELPEGSRFGYGLKEAVWRDARVAVVPIGYWHGYPRCLSSIGSVIVNGKRAKVLGAISMDILVIDVTDIEDVHTGTYVTFIGKDGGDEITAEELAGMADTTNYEMVTRINPLIKRYYI